MFRSFISTMMPPKRIVTPVGAYLGPGDIYPSNDLMWGGLRAFSAAAIGQAAIDLIRDDTVVTTVVTVAGGGLDPSVLVGAGWLSGHTAHITKVYDQTGHSLHWVPPSAAQRPEFLLVDDLITKPRMAFSTTADTALYSPPVGVTIDSVTMSIFYNRYLNLGAQHGLTTCSGEGLFGYDTDNAMLYRGTVQTFSAPDYYWHAINVAYNKTTGNATANVDGTETTFGIGTDGWPSTSLMVVGNQEGGGLGIGAHITEFGWWDANHPTYLTDASNQQHTHYAL